MTKQEIAIGPRQGRRLCQEKWADQAEIKAVDELIAEGLAVATDWEYSDNFQCARRYVVRKEKS